MASGPALPVPRLAVGCLEPFLPSNTHSGAFELARNLLLAGVGQPEDWERSKGDPVAFMLQTRERVAAAVNRKAIRESIVNGFEDLRHFLRMMEALGELMALLPGCDVLEEQK
jgi:hypothetical protein